MSLQEEMGSYWVSTEQVVARLPGGGSLLLLVSPVLPLERKRGKIGRVTLGQVNPKLTC